MIINTDYGILKEEMIVPLANGDKFFTYRVEKLPSSHLLKVLGFRKGIEFTLQSKQPLKGPIVVKVGSRCIAINYDMAKRIEVKEVAQH